MRQCFPPGIEPNSKEGNQASTTISPPHPSAEILEITRVEAQDRFEVKVKIINYMGQWDPAGDWMGSGARALDNMRTASGEVGHTV